ncbi:MAG TPA: serine--tRNA ligase, partial [Chthoniobacterales bacterium]
MKKRLATRGGRDELAVDEILRVDTERRKAETSVQQLNAERKRLSKEIGAKRARGEGSQELEDQGRAIGDKIAQLNQETTALDEKQRMLLLQIPNLPHESVPVGSDAGGNVTVRTWGNKPEFDYPVLDHVALGEKHHLFDLERAAKLSGSGFICFTGAGAKLERALRPLQLRSR